MAIKKGLKTVALESWIEKVCSDVEKVGYLKIQLRANGMGATEFIERIQKAGYVCRMAKDGIEVAKKVKKKK